MWPGCPWQASLRGHRWVKKHGLNPHTPGRKGAKNTWVFFLFVLFFTNNEVRNLLDVEMNSSASVTMWKPSSSVSRPTCSLPSHFFFSSAAERCDASRGAAEWHCHLQLRAVSQVLCQCERVISYRLGLLPWPAHWLHQVFDSSTTARAVFSFVGGPRKDAVWEEWGWCAYIRILDMSIDWTDWALI